VNSQRVDVTHPAELLGRAGMSHTLKAAPPHSRIRYNYKVARKLDVSQHANDQMWKRQITLTEAEGILNDPEIEWAGRKGATVMVGRVAGRRVKIVVRSLGNEMYRLITVAGPDE
jgi:hypothetical protein